MTERPDLSTPRRVHIVGAGGSGMSAIATVLLGMGHGVRGSDAADSEALRRIGAEGADVHVGHDAAWVGDADVFAVSSAIPADNAEVAEARSRGLRVWRRAELLAAICEQRRVVAVAGTHGKTSTSAMLATIAVQAGLHPSYIVGGDVPSLGHGAAWDPAGEWMIVEADESDGTFLHLGAEAVIVTSVEPDHLDFYGDENGMRNAFELFVADASGPVVACADDPGAAALVSDDGWTYGTSEGATVRLTDVSVGRDRSTFKVEGPHGAVAALWKLGGARPAQPP